MSMTSKQMVERKVCAHINKINKKRLNGKALTQPGLCNGRQRHSAPFGELK